MSDSSKIECFNMVTTEETLSAVFVKYIDRDTDDKETIEAIIVYISSNVSISVSLRQL